MPEIKTKEEFKAYVADIRGGPGYLECTAYAIGIARLSKDGDVLDVWYPCPNIRNDSNSGTAAVLAKAVQHRSGNGTYVPSDGVLKDIEDTFGPFLKEDGHPNVKAIREIRSMAFERIHTLRPVVTFIADLGIPPETVEDVYLRLHLLSHRSVKPNSMNLDGIFKILPNVAWTSEGPVASADLDDRRYAARKCGSQLTVLSVDKFPRMVDYVVPSGVRIADADRVRLGAYLGEGTTVMHEGFVNFNAGTEGPDNMVEGRISAGVFVGAGSDLGGGSSTMGTLSGGGTERVSVGRSCLLGANSGIGISLGDRCTVEAGLYVTAGTVVVDFREGLSGEKQIKARELSGQSDLLILRDSLNGRVIVRKNTKPNKPNVVLHTNQ